MMLRAVARMFCTIVLISVICVCQALTAHAQVASTSPQLSAGNLTDQDVMALLARDRSFGPDAVPWWPVFVQTKAGAQWYVQDYFHTQREEGLVKWMGRLFVDAKTGELSKDPELYAEFGERPSNVSPVEHLLIFIDSNFAAASAMASYQLTTDYSVYKSELWFDSGGGAYYRIDFVRYDSYSQKLLWGVRALVNAADGSVVTDPQILTEAEAHGAFIPPEFDPVTKALRADLAKTVRSFFSFPVIGGALALFFLFVFLYYRFHRRVTLSGIDWAFIAAVVGQLAAATVLFMLSPASFLAGWLLVGALGTITTWISTRATTMMMGGSSIQDLEVIKSSELPKFSDIGGMESVKEEIRNTIGIIVQFGEKAGSMGIRFNGVLLSGPPGVGKTYIARAIAGEYGLNFIGVKASDVLNPYLGGSSQQIGKIFKKAAESSPCLLFFDEFDSIARRRGNASVMVEDTRIVNQLLQSIEGARSLKGKIIIMAATNDRGALDEAVIRPGRFDRHIAIPMPDLEARRLIIERILKDKPVAKDIDLKVLARIAEGMSAAEISIAIERAVFTLLNSAVKNSSPNEVVVSVSITQQQLVDAFRGLYAREKQTVKWIGWDDLIVSEETMRTLKRLVKLIEDPSATEGIGIDVPKGILLHGPPGTGKTTIARVIANEANASFKAVSTADLYVMWLGESEQKIRTLFDEARKHKPSIIFIDEIDSLMTTRASGGGSASDYIDNIKNQILQEIDGIKDSTGLFVIGATNRMDLLDPALLRGGRLSEKIEIPLPELPERIRLFENFLQKTRLAGDVDKDALAKQATGFSGADIKAAVQQAKLDAFDRDGKEAAVSQTDMMNAIEKVLFGAENRSRRLNKKEKETTAYHEAGHALVASVLPHATPVNKVTIISRADALGYVWPAEEDKKSTWRQEYLDNIAVYLAGYAAEMMLNGDVTSGPRGDLQVATTYARAMVTNYGMSEKLGEVAYYDDKGKSLSGNSIPEVVAQRIDEEVHAIVKDARRRAEEVLTQHRAALDAIAHVLIEKETLNKEEFEKLLIANGITPKKKEDIEHQPLV